MQLASDGRAVDSVFGDQVDYVMLVKLYGRGQRHAMPGQVRRGKHVIEGTGTTAISTSYVERSTSR